MKQSISSKQRIIHILTAIEDIFEMMEGKNFESLVNEKILSYAVVRCFEIIGEASSKINNKIKKKNNKINWLLMKDMRNILIHEYQKVDLIVIWETIQFDLKPLKDDLEYILENENFDN